MLAPAPLSPTSSPGTSPYFSTPPVTLQFWAVSPGAANPRLIIQAAQGTGSLKQVSAAPLPPVSHGDGQVSGQGSPKAEKAVGPVLPLNGQAGRLWGRSSQLWEVKRE